MQIAAPAVPAVVTLLVFTTLALFVVALRVYTRVFVVKNVGADDYLMVGSMLGSIGFLVVIFIQIKFGLGRAVTFEELPKFLMALWGTIPLYNLALILCKISIAIQYYRVFRTPAVQRMLKGIFAFLIVYGLWTIIGNILTCVPVQKYWDFTVTDGVCLDRNAITFVNAGMNIVTDLTLLAIPILLLRRLQITRRQKYILMGVFACGGLACAMSIIRLRSLYQIGHAPLERQSIDGVNIAIWSCIEINVGIICASVPAIKALVVQVFPKLLLSYIYPSRSKNNPYAGSRYAHHHHQRQGQQQLSDGGETGGGCGGGPSSSSSASKEEGKARIMVRQSFEMNAVTRRDAGVVGDSTEAGSRDGSENNLVLTGWKTDCYAVPGKNRSGN